MSSDSERLHKEVSIWLARLERGLQPQDAAQLREWLQVPAQRDAIVEAAKLYHGPDIVAILAEMVPVGFGNAPANSRKRRRLSLTDLTVGALLLPFVLAPFWIAHRTMPGLMTGHYRPSESFVPWNELVYTSPVDKTQRVKLPDGTAIMLNRHSRLGIVYGPTSRQARLEYGEAVFQVAGDPNRPFDINAAGRHLRAPTSRFDLRVIDPKSVELTVLDGGVTIQALPWRWPTNPEEARMFDPEAFKDATLGPMQAALMEANTTSRFPVTAANVRERLSWQPEEVLYITP